LRPAVHFRAHEQEVNEPLKEDYTLVIRGREYEIVGPEKAHPLRLFVHSERASFTHEGGQLRQIGYQSEADRGYPSRGALWSPGYFTIQLRPNHQATLVASTEPWRTIAALDPQTAFAAALERRDRLLAVADPRLQSGEAAELVLAADQFIVAPAGRVE